MREKVGKSRNTVFFQWFVAPEGRKVGSLKRRVRSQLARGEMKNCTPLWREAHFQVEMYKTSQNVQNTSASDPFGSWDVKKVHAVVARSTFPSQNAQNTAAPDHFWKLWCRKSARRCGAKHISKSKCTKHQGFGPLLEVAMSKKCTPLWREAHFQVKSVKNWRSRTTPKGSKIEKNQSRLIFSLEIDFLKKINRFRLIFEKINRKKIKRTYAQNQSNFGSKINRKWKEKSIEHVWYEACFHMTIGHYLFMQEAELSSPNIGANEWKGYPAQTKV